MNHKKTATPIIKNQITPDRVIMVVLGFILVLYSVGLMVAGTSIEERMIILRYWNMLITGFYAFSIPHFYYPDRNITLLQLLNFSPGKLIKYQFNKHRLVFAGLASSYIVIAFWAPSEWLLGLSNKLVYLIEGWLFLTGIYLVSFSTYSKIGFQVKRWQVEKKGEKIRKFNKEMGAGGLPAEQIPTFNATIILTLAGMLLVVLGSYFSHWTSLNMDWIPGVFLTFAGLASVLTKKSNYDQLFYHTNAIYSDLFVQPGSNLVQDQRSIKIEQIYWTPGRWRPSAWAGILQLDRKFPMGRIIFIGHLLLWVLFFKGVEPQVQNAYLVMFVMLHYSGLYMLITPEMGPVSWNYRMQSGKDWIASRFFIQIRWVVPFFLSLGGIAIFSSSLTWLVVLFWSLVYVFGSLIAAALVTKFHESRIFN